MMIIKEGKLFGLSALPLNKWLVLTVTVAVLAYTGLIVKKEVEHNRFHLQCVLQAMSFMSPDILSFSQLRELAAAGNDRDNRWAQSKLIDDYSNASWAICFPHDDNKFYDFLETTAAQGWAESQHMYTYVAGRMHNPNFPSDEIFDEREDIETAFSYLMSAAEKGVGNAQHLLSIAYAAGRWGDSYRDGRCEATIPSDNHGVLCSYTDVFVDAQWGDKSLIIAKDPALSLKWLEAAIQSYASGAMYDLATRYRYGKYGVVQDNQKAFELYSQTVAEQNDTRAMAQLALMYAEGAGVERNIETARDWMKRALVNSPSNQPEMRDFYQTAYNQLGN